MQLRLLGASLGVCIALNACASTESELNPPGSRPSLRDSAGVAIVEYWSLDGADTSAWHVNMSDSVRIGRTGAMDFDPDYQVGRAIGATRLSDGRIAVADWLAFAIRTYRADGSFEDYLGRRGEGPGEFTRLTGLLPFTGDSLLALEGDARWKLLDSAGHFEREGVLFPIGVTFPRIWGLFDDGTLAVLHRSGTVRSAFENGIMLTESSTRFFRMDLGGELIAEFGTFPDRANLQMPVEGTHPVNPQQVMWIVSPTPGPIHVANGARFFWADAGLWEVRVYRADGVFERVIRFDRASLDSESLPSFSLGPDEVLVAPALARVWRDLRSEVGVSPFSDFTVDAEGNLWLREHVDGAKDVTDSARWYVFDVEGFLRHVVRLPRSWRTRQNGLEIGADHVLALEQDDFTVDTYVVVPLIRR